MKWFFHKPSKTSRVDRTASVLQEVYKDYDAVRRSLDVPWISWGFHVTLFIPPPSPIFWKPKKPFLRQKMMNLCKCWRSMVYLSRQQNMQQKPLVCVAECWENSPTLVKARAQAVAQREAMRKEAGLVLLMEILSVHSVDPYQSNSRMGWDCFFFLCYVAH